MLVTFVQDVFKVDYIFLMKALHCIGGLHSENKTFSLTANMNSFAWKFSVNADQEMVVSFITITPVHKNLFFGIIKSERQIYATF